MAIVNQNEDEENQNGNASPTGGPVQVAGTAGASASGGAKPSAPSSTSPVLQNNAAQQNPGYVDVSSYLAANQPGSSAMGDKAAGYLTDTYNNTKGAIDTSVGNANTAISGGYTPENTDLIQQVLADPTSAVQDPNKVSGFQGQLNDTYTGPNNWADLGDLQGKVADATQVANLNKTPGGNNVLAQKLEGSNTSQGINQLDALLLGSDPTAAGKIQAASDPFNTLNDYLNSQNTAVTGNIGTAQGNASAAKQAALDGINTAQSNLQNEITARQQQGEAQRLAYNQQIQDIQNKLIPAENNLKAFNTSLGTQYPGTLNDPFATLTSLQPNGTPATVANSATSDNYARDAALKSLAGGAYTPQLNPALSNQAGTFVAPTAPNPDFAGLGKQGTIELATELKGSPFDRPGTVFTPTLQNQWNNSVSPAEVQLVNSLQTLGLSPEQIEQIYESVPRP